MWHAPSTGSRSPGDLVILFLALAIGIAIRLVQVGYAFDTDEAFSAALAGQPFSQAVQEALADRSHPPLHVLLLHFWIRLFGTSEAAARAMSLFAYAGFVLVAWRILRRYATGVVLGGAMLLVAVSPLYVYYGQMARPYALVMLASALVFERYLALADAPDERARRWGWALVCAFAMYTQYLAALVIAACMAASLTRSARLAVPTVVYGAIGAAAVLPWLVAAMLPAAGAEPILGMIQWMEKPTLGGFVWFYAGLFGVPDWGRLAYVLPVVLVLACLPLAAAAHRPATTEEDLRQRHDVVLWTLASFVVPLAAFLASTLGSYTIFVMRQFLGSQLALLALVALGLQRVSRAAAAGTLAALVVWTAASAPYALPQYTRPDWRTIAGAIEDAQRPYVAAERWVEWPLEYYARRPPLSTGANLDLVQANEFTIVCREPHCAQIRRQADEGWVVRSIATVTTAPRRAESLTLRVEVLGISVAESGVVAGARAVASPGAVARSAPANSPASADRLGRER